MNKSERNQFMGFMCQLGFNFYITLNPNQSTKSGCIPAMLLEEQKRELNRWRNYADRRLLGKRYQKNPNRTFFFAFPEIGPKGGLLHWNLCVKAPTTKKDLVFRL